MIGTAKNTALTYVVKTAVRVDGATSGALFLLDRTQNVLRIGVHAGLPDGYVPDAVVIREGDGTASGDAAFSRHRVVVRDVSSDEYSAWRTNALELGIQAIQAAPLVDDGSHLLGVLSTFYDRPHHPTQFNLGRLDLCGELAVAILVISEEFEVMGR